MGPSNLEIAPTVRRELHFLDPIEPVPVRGAWIARCGADILAREPWLALDDVADLAATLWDRPSCQQATPELAVEFLFKGQLNRLR